MKIEGGRIINNFIEPNKHQYAIPVYQRNYEWLWEEDFVYRARSSKSQSEAE